MACVARRIRQPHLAQTPAGRAAKQVTVLRTYILVYMHKKRSPGPPGPLALFTANGSCHRAADCFNAFRPGMVELLGYDAALIPIHSGVFPFPFFTFFSDE